MSLKYEPSSQLRSGVSGWPGTVSVVEYAAAVFFFFITHKPEVE